VLPCVLACRVSLGWNGRYVPSERCGGVDARASGSLHSALGPRAPVFSLRGSRVCVAGSIAPVLWLRCFTVLWPVLVSRVESNVGLFCTAVCAVSSSVWQRVVCRRSVHSVASWPAATTRPPLEHRRSSVCIVGELYESAVRQLCLIDRQSPYVTIGAGRELYCTAATQLDFSLLPTASHISRHRQ